MSAIESCPLWESCLNIWTTRTFEQLSANRFLKKNAHAAMVTKTWSPSKETVPGHYNKHRLCPDTRNRPEQGFFVDPERLP